MPLSPQDLAPERTFTLATAQRQNSKFYAVRDITWSEFIDWLDLPHPSSVRECGQYVPATFRSTANGKVVRDKETFHRRHLITLDADYAEQGFIDKLHSLGFRAAAHTTFRSTDAAPRWRVIIQPDRSLDAEEYHHVARALAHRLGADQFDATTFQPERFMYRPSTQGDYDYVIVDGPEAPAAVLLGEGRALPSGRVSQDVTETYSGPEFAELPEDQQQAIRGYVNGVISHWEQLLSDAVSWDENYRDSDGRGWRQLLLEGAWAIAKVAVAPWSSLAEDDAQAMWESLVPEEMTTDPNLRGLLTRATLDKAAGEPVENPPPPRPSALNDFGDLADEFFETTPVLKHVKVAAEARGAAPTATLAYVLCRLISMVPITTHLPPVIGGKGSVNLAVAAVGPSGSGKSTLIQVSRDVLGMVSLWQEDIERNLGSGEGIVQTFLRWDPERKENVLVEEPHRIMIVDEVDQFHAASSRQGSTLAPILRSALTGGSLGQENAAAERKRHVPAGSYRLAMFLGIQPTRSGPILKDADAGTPQRFLWVRTENRLAPDEMPPWPGMLKFDDMPKCPEEIKYPDHIKDEIRRERTAVLRGESDNPLLGHQMLLRLKVAFALGLLHRETEITEQWWELAGVLMDSSLEVQQHCIGVVAAEARREADERARSAGRAAAITERAATAEKEAVEHGAEVALRAVRKAGDDGIPWRKLSQSVGKKLRPHLWEAVALLEARGKVVVESVELSGNTSRRVYAVE